MKGGLAHILALVLFLFAAGPAYSQIYQWVDENGVVHLSDRPPLVEQQVESLELAPYLPPAPDSSSTSAPGKQERTTGPEKKARRPGKTEIYITSWCPHCKKAVAFLRTKGVRFQIYDIEKDARAKKRMHELGGTGGVPFAVIRGTTVLGFSKKRYEEALGLR